MCQLFSERVSYSVQVIRRKGKEIDTVNFEVPVEALHVADMAAGTATDKGKFRVFNWTRRDMPASPVNQS